MSTDATTTVLNPVFLPADDSYHQPPPDADRYWTETNWWSLNVPERRLGLWLHCQHHPIRETVTWRVFAWDPRGADPGRLAYYKRLDEVPMPRPEDGSVPDLRDITFPAGGYSVKVLKPTLDYHISYADPEVGFALDIEHRSVHEPRRFPDGEAPMMHAPHFDQLGHVIGELTLHGERIPVDCYSVRDRTWGPRGGAYGASRKKEHLAGQYEVRNPGGPTWRQVERERGRGRIDYIFGHADDRTGFLSFVRPQDGEASGRSPLNAGYLIRDGETQPIDKTKSWMKNYRDPHTGWNAHMEVFLTDVTGRTAEVEGFSVSHMCENGTGSNALFRWEMDGRTMWGEDQDGWKPDHWKKLMAALRETR